MKNHALAPKNTRSSALMRLLVMLGIVLSCFLVCINSAYAVTVTSTPGSAADCTSVAGIGTRTWTNPSRAISSNNSYATVSVDGTTTVFLKCLNYGFAIPASATINGIRVAVERKSSRTSNGGSLDAAMRVVKAGAIGATDRSTATLYTTSDFTETHGSAVDLWGQAWTAADINAATFGAAFSAKKISAAGNSHTVSVDVMQITVDYTPDTTPPVVSSITLANASPSKAASLAWTVVFSESVTGVDAADFALVQAGGVSGASITSVTGGGTTWTVTANTGIGSGTLGLNLIDNDTIIDLAGNKLGGTGVGNGNLTGAVYTMDRLNPLVSSITRFNANPTNAASVAWTVVFTESVSGVDAADFLLVQTGVSGASLTTVTGGGTTWTVTANTGIGSGTLGLNLVDDDTIIDGLGNRLGGVGAGNGNFTGEVYTVDKAVPTVTSISRADTDPTGATSVSWTVVFSEGVTGVDAADFALAQAGVSGAGITSVTGSGTTWIVTGNTGSGSGSLGLNLVDNDTIIDLAANKLGGTGVGNGNLTGQGYTIDKINPFVLSISRADPDPTSALSVSWTVIFNESVAGVDPTNFVLVESGGVSGTSITSVTGSGTTWTVTAATGGGSGKLGLNLIDDDSIVDIANNPLGGAGAGNGNFTGALYTISRTATFDMVEVAQAKATPIYTKLSGVNFSLDILAIDTSGNINTSYNKIVSVKLVDATSGCSAASPLLKDFNTFTFVPGDKGRKNTGALSYAGAARNARFLIKETTSAISACSSDGFSVRPTSFTITSTNATNTTYAGAPTFNTGASFNLTATALAGYDGTPSLSSTLVWGSPNAGTLAGNFGAATAAAGVSGANFTYGEVGKFGLKVNAVFDDAFTDIDQNNNDCTDDFSNALVGGQYGCNFGSVEVLPTVASGGPGFGRFIPDHFDISAGLINNRTDLACAPASAFTYTGEAFGATFALTACNSAAACAGDATKTANNYAGNYANLTPTALAAYNFLGATAANVAVGLTGGTVAGAWASGVLSVTLANIAVSRAAAHAPYANFQLGTAPIDSDLVALSSTALTLNLDAVPGDDHAAVAAAATEIRFGRLWMGNAYGTEKRNLSLAYETQYWNGQAFVRNALDNCTALTAANFGLGNYQGSVTSINLPATAVSMGTAFSAGGGSIRFAAPNARGSVDVVAKLGATASMCPPGWAPTYPAGTPLVASYLQGSWCGGTFVNDPVVRATFGIFGSSLKKGPIYVRESF